MNLIPALVFISVLVLANYLVLWFGPWMTIANSFILVGFELSFRDYLHEKWRTNRIPKFVTLALAASLITYLINNSAQRIALASATAIGMATIVDTLIYQLFSGYSYKLRSNVSNVCSAIVDSSLFFLIAFQTFHPEIVAMQILSKVLGGLLWTIIISTFFFRVKTQKE